jgi:hypothetical protein
MLWAASEAPQFMQNDAPCRFVVLQWGQTGSAEAFAGGLVDCTGVPHSWQNFFPVTSVPQDAQVAIGSHLPY